MIHTGSKNSEFSLHPKRISATAAKLCNGFFRKECKLYRQDCVMLWIPGSASADFPMSACPSRGWDMGWDTVRCPAAAQHREHTPPALPAQTLQGVQSPGDVQGFSWDQYTHPRSLDTPSIPCWEPQAILEHLHRTRGVCSHS